MAKPTGTVQETDPASAAWQTLCRFGVVKLLLGFAIVVNVFQILSFHSVRQEQQDFAHYYVTSKLWLDGENIYGVELQPHYEKLGWDEFDEPVDHATNPPPLLALFAPFASLDPPIAHSAWMLAQLLALVCAVWFAWKCVRGTISFDGFSLLLAIFLFLPFLKVHFYYSQIQLLLMAMILLAQWLSISAYSSEGGSRLNGILGCVVIAIAALIKIYPLVLLPWFVWRSDKKMAGRFTAGLVAATTLVVGVWLTDIGLWRGFFEHGLSTVSTWIKASLECFTIGNALHQFGSVLTGDHDTDLFVQVGSTIGISLLGVFYIRLLYRSVESGQKQLNVELALLILLMLFCGGTCWWHYLVFLFFPFQVIASQLKDRRSFVPYVVVFLGLLLFANIHVPTSNFEILNRLLNQRPLMGMFFMAAFLSFNLKSTEHQTVAER